MKKPRIALVTSVIDGREGRGTAVIARRFLEQLDNFKDEFDFTLIHYDRNDDPLYKKYPELTMPETGIPFAKQMMREAVFWTRQWLAGDRFDVVHHLNARVWPTYLLSAGRRVVVTPYEAGVMLDIHRRGRTERLFSFTNRHLHQRMHGIVTCTNYSKQQIIDYYHVEKDRVFIIPLGIDPRFKPVPMDEAQVSRLETVYGIKRPYLLSVARFDPHKNILRLVEAYALFRKAGGKIPLVLAGGRHTIDYSKQVDERIQEFRLSETVYIAAFIPDEDMPLLYSGAEALVFPSLNEGWGMPITESFACGTPVLTASTTATGEVGGKDALLFDPYDPNDMAEKMLQVATDPVLRDSLRKKGLARAENYTWEKMAANMVEMYRALLRG